MKIIERRIFESRAAESQEERATRLQQNRERKITYRAAESEEERATRLQQTRERNITNRAAESQEDRTARLQKDKQRHANSRADESQEDRTTRLQTDKQRHTDSRANEAPEKRTTRLQKNKERNRDSRNSETQQETAQRLESDRTRRAAYSERCQTHVKRNIATKSSEILHGIIYVPKLSDTEDSIGKMDQVCKDCKALQYKNETGIMCCGRGKVQEPSFPKPPDPLHNLWYDNTDEAKVFRENSRSINNAVCHASLAVGYKEKDRDNYQKINVEGYSPTVIFHGKVAHFMPPPTASWRRNSSLCPIVCSRLQTRIHNQV